VSPAARVLPPKRRSGFAALIGRPNVGKSTLLNRLAGEKLAIVSPKPQTTRTRILGVVNRPEGQVALVDTPGIHEAKAGLNRYMVDVALQALDDVELLLFVIEPEPKAISDISAETRFILDRIARAAKPTFLVINKVDAISKPLLLPLIERYRTEYAFAQVIPISAKKGDGVEALLSSVLEALPEGEPLFSEEMLTDQAERTLVAEYVREQVLHHCRQEIPYSTAVLTEVFDESEREPRAARPEQAGKRNGLAGLIRIGATIYVERESQKAIVIGKRGQMLKEIGTAARKQIEQLLGTHIFLSLRVKVEPGWSESPKTLRKLGYE
jgi:GTP-binding protein Era